MAELCLLIAKTIRERKHGISRSKFKVRAEKKNLSLIELRDYNEKMFRRSISIGTVSGILKGFWRNLHLTYTYMFIFRVKA
jgi:hypothetical protein